ncbi:hypothetical protein QB833_001726 [Salmonella enterica]|nr:hypothetical protein [Salmonella enterica]
MQINQLPVSIPVCISPHFNGAIVLRVVNGKADRVMEFNDVDVERVKFNGGRPPHPLKKEALTLARELMAKNPDMSRYRLIIIVSGKLAEKWERIPSTRSLDAWFKQEFIAGYNGESILNISTFRKKFSKEGGQ